MESTLSKRPFAHFLLGMCMGFGGAIIIDVDGSYWGWPTRSVSR